MPPSLVITIPCFNEDAVLTETVGRLSELVRELISDQNLIAPGSRILLVNDGSTDNTWPVIQQLHQTNPFVCGLNLAGNVGQQNALMAGLETAKEFGDIVVTIDADLQDDIGIIPEMIQKYLTGCDIVYGVRKERKTDTWFKRVTARGFYKLMDRLGVKSVYNHADYRLMSKRAVEQLCRYQERNLFLRGIIPTLGYKTAFVYYDRAERFAGESKYPLRKMVNFALDGITSFSIRPVRIISLIGVVFLLIALGIFVYVVFSLIRGNTVSGWASLILSIWLIGGCTLLGIGVIGEYIGKIYLEVKNRPRYNIESRLLK